ncbi:hypothetical protein NA57DRAFT_73559 [Rhizodiscina lignyota]|uniref:Uncharacterized protein n=1 Tax=Rhizodiscina lignyota TaxID=1504668 RepID=A0A9P4IPF4_9PEZI|nr:hypothetical protein NA57DRAFT_73559 [Rhizodiscina lignyota]
MPSFTLSQYIGSWAAQKIFLISRYVSTSSHDVYHFLEDSIKSDADIKPRKSTVVWALICFATYLLLGALAIVFPSKSFLIVIASLAAVYFAGIAGKWMYDVIRSRNAEYKRNLANTVFVVLFSFILFTTMYEKRWHQQLTLEVIETRREPMLHPPYPAFALLQDMNATNQANLVSAPRNCFINQYDPEGPHCSDYTAQHLDASIKANGCNCSDNWVPGVQELHDGPNGTLSHRYISFQPQEYIVSPGANNYLTLQAYFTFNTTHPNGSALPEPVLWLMVYDPKFSFDEAYYEGYGLVNMFNANGPMNIDIDLTWYQQRNGSGYYFYDVLLSAVSNLNLLCDVTNTTGEYVGLCHTSLIIQVPRSERTVQIQKMSMEWPDVIAEAGSYFALVQLLGWVFSGQLLAAD